MTEQQSLLDNQNPALAVQNELSRIDALKAMIADDGEELDTQLILDTIEGETDMHELLLEIDDSIAEYEAQADVVAERIKKLAARKARFGKSADTLRTIILSAMDKAGIQKVEGACATLCLKKKAAALNVTEEEKIPSKYWGTKPVLDKKTLLKDIKNGEAVPGAELGAEGISLMIRRA